MKVVLLVPTGVGVGLTSVALGMLRSFERQGVDVGFCKPIAQLAHGYTGPERSTTLVAATSKLTPPMPISLERANHLLANDDEQLLMEEVVALVSAMQHEVVVLEGMVPTREVAWANQVNRSLMKSLDAELVLVGMAEPESSQQSTTEFFDIAARSYGDISSGNYAGCVVNRVRGLKAPPLSGQSWADRDRSDDWRDVPEISALADALHQDQLKPRAFVPEMPALSWLRVSDIAANLHAKVLNAGDWSRRRVQRITVCARSMPKVLHAFKQGSLIVVPSDRIDILTAASLASLKGVNLAGLLLTCGGEVDPEVLALLQPACAIGLPILLVDSNSYDTANQIHDMDREVSVDDMERADWVLNTIASYLDPDWVQNLVQTARRSRLSPPAFRHQLMAKARAAAKRIVLPEGDELRTLTAAAICQRRGIAQCVLLGDPEKIRTVAGQNGIDLPSSLEILDPETVAPAYVEPMVALRKHKGLTPAMALERLGDTVVLGTMMLQQGRVDGLVSGAVHTTADTIRPALQLIKTAPGVSLVSSVFFMCLPDEVLVYGDCAVNPDPTADQLAEIALQSAGSARAFGIDPRVAMLSYSTGSSGSGSEVEKVRRATEIVREQAPDLVVDGPMQYDAAVTASVAQSKMPGSPVAGKATVCVFPDLNTGNTTYKAVQRSADVVSIGPMLQGLAKPVNDLSRGALVDDIVYTIALTAIQAADLIVEGKPVESLTV